MISQSQLNVSFSLSLLFMGFLVANLYGIVTNSAIVFLFVLAIEFINQLVYTRKRTFVQTPTSVLKVLNFFKVGLEFGFFVDAFKLGS